MNPANTQRIASFIWGIADDVLRDLYVRGKYRDVILPFTVLRRLDAVLEPTKQKVLELKRLLDKAKIVEQDESLRGAAGQAFWNTSPFTLRELRGRSSQARLQQDFLAYLDGFSPNVQSIIDNFEVRQQISKLAKADALGALIEKFLDPAIDLSPAGLDNHAMGTVFEELVRRFNESNNEEAGEHWTPRDAVRLMTRLIFDPIADQLPDVDRFIDRFLADADRSELDPILDRCAAEYIENLDEDDQIEFKSKAKAFVRTYAFLSLVLPFTNVGWEKLSLFLSMLLPKLPSPREDDLSAGILESIDMDSYRIEKRQELRIVLADEDGELDPVPTGNAAGGVDPELERLSEILSQFNDLFGNIDWDDADRIRERISTEIPEKVLADQDYTNAIANNDVDNAKLALGDALRKVMQGMLRDETQLFKQFADNPDFRKWLTDAIFKSTYDRRAA
jgi:hypothetical protein